MGKKSASFKGGGSIGNPYLFFIGPLHDDLFFSLSYILYLVNK